METTDAEILIVDASAGATVTAFLLREHGYRVRMVDDPRAAIPLVRDGAVDLILTDTALPYIDGFGLCVALRREQIEVPVIFVSGRDGMADRLRAFESGADDFIATPYHPTVLLARIGAVLRRGKRAAGAEPGSVVNVGKTSLDIGRAQFHPPNGPVAVLTPTETRILECLMRNAHATIARGRLMALTGGADGSGGSNRIDVYIRRLRRKIEAAPGAPIFIQTIRGVGFSFRDGRDATRDIG